MGVRVWGVVEDRLVELRAEPAEDQAAFGIIGLPEDRSRTTADRVRAALLNSGLLSEAPPAVVRLEPAVGAGTTSDLDLPIALAALAGMGQIGTGLRWVLASGRLGLDGTVHARELTDRRGLADVVESLCQTRMLGFEHTFEGERR
jgi:predicted ATPase with chaperone activity